jgi:predicted peptidase
MKTILHFFLLLVAIGTGYTAAAQETSTAYSNELFISNGDSLRYRLLTPANYDIHKSYPIIIFLHGSGERGDDNNAQLLHGGDLFLKDSLRQAFPAFVLFPQCPADQSWAPMKLKRDQDGKVIDATFDLTPEPTKPGALVKKVLDSLLATGKINKKQVYLGGLSLGGMGTYDMLARYPDVFAAAFPICGAGDVKATSRYGKKVPMWIFHGGDDTVVPVEFSRTFYKVLKGMGAKVKYTEYAGVGHNSWDNAFAEPDLLPWLFSNKKK